jgi:hypothetical protein
MGMSTNFNDMRREFRGLTAFQTTNRKFDDS